MKSKVYYGWYVVLAGFILMAAAMGIGTNCFGLFINPVCEELNFTRSEMQANATIISAITMLVSLFSAKLFSRFSMHMLMKMSAVVICYAYFSYSYANSIAVFYLLSICVGISYALLTNLSISIILSNWFYEKKGLVIGLVFTGSAIGGMVFSALAGAFIEIVGWRSTYQILGIILGILILPCVFLIIKVRPEEMGLLPFGKKMNIKGNDKEKSGLGLKEAFKNPMFWAMCIGIMLCSLSMATLVFTIAPHLNNVGYSITYSANVVAVSMGVLAIGKLLMGQMFDWIGTALTTFIACVFIFLGLVGMIFANYFIAIVLIVVGVGIGTAYGSVGYQILTHNALSNYKFSAIYGFIAAASNLGGTFSPIINGYIYDCTGSYTGAFIFAAISILFASIVFQFSLPKKDNR